MSESTTRCERIATGAVVVWKVPLDPSGVAREPWLATLDEHEAAHARRLGDAGAPWAQAHTALRGILGLHLRLAPRAVQLRLGSGGKPELAIASPLSFSMSRSDGLALIAVSCERALGVDLERVNDDLDVNAVAAAFLPPGEIAAIEMAPPASRRHAFFAAWTRYEARLKLRGTGLGATDAATPSPLILVRAIPLGDRYAAAVAAEGGSWHVDLREWTGTA
jgi:4'-phosphopantetheinyl transferase